MTLKNCLSCLQVVFSRNDIWTISCFNVSKTHIARSTKFYQGRCENSFKLANSRTQENIPHKIVSFNSAIIGRSSCSRGSANMKKGSRISIDFLVVSKSTRCPEHHLEPYNWHRPRILQPNLFDSHPQFPTQWKMKRCHKEPALVNDSNKNLNESMFVSKKKQTLEASVLWNSTNIISRSLSSDIVFPHHASFIFWLLTFIFLVVVSR